MSNIGEEASEKTAGPLAFLGLQRKGSNEDGDEKRSDETNNDENVDDDDEKNEKKSKEVKSADENGDLDTVESSSSQNKAEQERMEEMDNTEDAQEKDQSEDSQKKDYSEDSQEKKNLNEDDCTNQSMDDENIGEDPKGMDNSEDAETQKPPGMVLFGTLFKYMGEKSAEEPSTEQEAGEKPCTSSNEEPNEATEQIPDEYSNVCDSNEDLKLSSQSGEQPMETDEDKDTSVS